MTITMKDPETSPTELRLWRVNALRFGYLFMSVGLMLVKWPLMPHAYTMPLYEGVTNCILSAMSLLALLGLRYPVKMLPVLLFETLWKAIWLGIVAIPRAVTGAMNDGATTIMINCFFVVVIVAVIPWGYVWRSYFRSTGDDWR